MFTYRCASLRMRIYTNDIYFLRTLSTVLSCRKRRGENRKSRGTGEREKLISNKTYLLYNYVAEKRREP